MRDQEFDRIMQSWAEHEQQTAPEIRPTAEVYRMVRAMKRQEPVFAGSSRRAVWAIATFGLMAVLVLYTVLFQAPLEPLAPAGQAVAHVRLRQAFTTVEGDIVTGPTGSGEKGNGRGAPIFDQLQFQFQRADARLVEGIDLQMPQEVGIVLNWADNYRLFLQPARDSYVYVFQMMPSRLLVQLFPNRQYSILRNPLRRGEPVILPSEPNWFYLSDVVGRVRLYILASSARLVEVEDLNAQYNLARDPVTQQGLRSSLLQAFTDASDRWQFDFEYR